MTRRLTLNEPISLGAMRRRDFSQYRNSSGLGSVFSSILHTITGTPTGAQLQTQVDQQATTQAEQIAVAEAPSLLAAQQASLSIGNLDAMLTQYRLPILLGGGAILLILLLKHKKA